MSPKSLYVNVVRYWSFVVALMELSREHSNFDYAHLLRVLGREHPDLKGEDQRQAIARLHKCGLLQESEGGSELHYPTLAHLEALHKERPLGSFGVIEGHVKALRDAIDELAVGIDSSDFSGRIAQANKLLMRQSRELQGQVEADFEAILSLIEQAKSSDADIPRSDRYDLVLKAHEQYLLPMMELISVDGAFSGYLAVAVERLVEASGRARRSNVAGRLEHELEATAVRLRSLPAQIRERMGRAAKLLRPVVDQARKHNELARQVALIMGTVRKRGATAALPAQVLPSFIRTRQYTLRLGLSLDAVIATARASEAAPRQFPDLSPRPSRTGAVPVVRMGQMLRALRLEAEPVQDLFAWIHARYPHLGREMTLNAYLHLIRHFDDRPGRSLEPTAPTLSRTLQFSTGRLKYTPHGLKERL